MMGFCSALAGSGFKVTAWSTSASGPPRAIGGIAGLAGAAAAPAAAAAGLLCPGRPAGSEAIEVCLANGWRVPEDFAVMGTGNIEISCECSHVPISSIDLGEEEIAFKAATLLDRLMRGRNPRPAPS